MRVLKKLGREGRKWDVDLNWPPGQQRAWMCVSDSLIEWVEVSPWPACSAPQNRLSLRAFISSSISLSLSSVSSCGLQNTENKARMDGSETRQSGRELERKKTQQSSHWSSLFSLCGVCMHVSVGRRLELWFLGAVSRFTLALSFNHRALHNGWQRLKEDGFLFSFSLV